MEKLKIYDVDIISNDAGITKVSFVDDPAFGVKFAYFSAEKANFNISDEEKRIVYGPVIIPDKPILRVDQETGDKYAVRFSREVIRAIADKYFKEKNIDKNNIHHEMDVDGVFVVRSDFKEYPTTNIDGFDDVPEGSWFLGFKVENDEVWKGVKEGNFSGLSMEIYYDLFDSGETQLFNQYNEMTKTKYSKYSAFRGVFKAQTGEKPKYSTFGSVMTDRGELAYDGNLTQDTEGVTLLTDGEAVLADGDFVLQTDDDRNGLVVLIENGVVVRGEEQAREEGTEMDEDGAESAAEQVANDVSEAITDIDELRDLLVEIQAENAEVIANIASDFSNQVASIMAEVKTIGERQLKPVGFKAEKPEEKKDKKTRSSMSGKDIIAHYTKK